MSRDQPVVRRARLVVAAVFFLNGAVLASWVPHIPVVKQRLAVGDGILGLVLLCMAAGALCALSVAGWLVARHGSRFITIAAALALCAALPLPLLAPSLLLVGLALFVLGAANGALDVSMNAQAVLVEQRCGRPIMSGFHGLFSLGGLAGAATAGLVTGLGASPAQHVLAMAALGVVAVAAVAGTLIDAPSAAHGVPLFVRPTGPLRWLGLLAFAALMAEGAMADWSAVYLHDTLASSPAIAATGFAAFSLLMTIGRLGGDRAIAAYGARAVLRISAGLAAGGLAAALCVATPLAGVIGCAVVGLGIANAIPILFSRAGSLPGVDAGVGLAAVASTGYLGFLAGPPLIGLAAESVGLGAALGVVVAACAVLAGAAGVVGGGAAGGRIALAEAAEGA